MSKTVFRRARHDEHADLVRLAKTSKYTQDYSNAQMFSSENAYAKGWIRVAEIDGVVVGLTCVRHKTRHPETMLYFVVTHPDYRSQSLGEQMLNDVMLHSPHRVMRLNVMKDNERAVNFYLRLGFKVVGTAIGEQALSLEKEYNLRPNHPMIVNLRGTSGSGKSTITRALMKSYASKTRVFVKGRDRPLGYILNHPGRRPLAVIGHYETDCGGCDTIKTIDEVYDIVRQCYQNGMDVFFEGLLLAAEYRRSEALHQDGLPLRVVALDTPLDVCVASVNQRREESYQRRLERTNAINSVKEELGHKPRPIPEPRGDVNPRNTESKYKATFSVLERLRKIGVPVFLVSREAALETIQELFDEA